MLVQDTPLCRLNLFKTFKAKDGTRHCRIYISTAPRAIRAVVDAVDVYIHAPTSLNMSVVF